jgi:hypothetical protein
MLLMRFSESPCPTGFDVKLDLVSVQMMDSGIWYWKYTIDGVYVKLNTVEL